jgi:hypothetical protein
LGSFFYLPARQSFRQSTSQFYVYKLPTSFLAVCQTLFAWQAEPFDPSRASFKTATSLILLRRSNPEFALMTAQLVQLPKAAATPLVVKGP